jgi:AcrR family transcriptional regulator
MRKGEMTRRAIVERSAPVFNTKGYSGASVSDLVRATGLEKGGIYNHFGSKEELSLATFEYAVGRIGERYEEALEGKEGALERLFAVIDVVSTLVEDPPVAGGCPILNTAVESDDANPVFKEKARGAMTGWHRLIGSITKRGVSRGELPERTDPYEMASLVTATLEGAIMLSKLYDDPVHMRRAVDHLKDHLRSLAREAGDR